MARCKECGKFSFFQFNNNLGLCKKCLEQEIARRKRVLQPPIIQPTDKSPGFSRRAKAEEKLKSINGVDEKTIRAIDALYAYTPKCPEMLVEVMGISFASAVELMNLVCDLGLGYWNRLTREYRGMVGAWAIDAWDYINNLSDEEVQRIERCIYRRHHIVLNAKKGDEVTYDQVEIELTRVDEMNGYEFEDWIAEVLGANGFNEVIVTDRSNDKGIDVFAIKNGKKYAFQCKCYHDHPLGNKPIQEVFTGKAIYGCDYAIVVTNAWFTDGAISMARAIGVELWDREALVPYVKNYLGK